jgi:outer membrane protein
MKKNVILTLVLAAFCASAATASAQQLKIGTVDMKKVFESYYKTKDAEAKINEARNNAKKELEDRLDIQKKAMEEVQKMNTEIENPALSKEAKETKTKGRDEKIAELRTMDRENTEFRSNREKQLQEQSVRMRAGIVEEINKIVDAKVKAESYDLVFDKSGPSLNGVPIVLYARDTYDFTPDVVTALNKNKGKESSEAAAPAAPAPAKDAAPAKKK